MWIDALGTNFLVHRSFSLAVFLLAIYLVNQNKKFYHIQSVQIIGWIITLEILAGIVLAYAAMPAFAQPIHLWLGIVLFAYVVYTLLITHRGNVARA
jgi:cytochrome c oxidase assembly protein subunit 15